MARTSVVTQQIVKEGITPALTSPNVDGDVIDTGRVFLRVDNTGASPVIATVVTPITVDGLAVEDLAVTVAAGGSKLLGPLSRSTFGQPLADVNAGRALVNYTGTPADIKRGVFAL